jgi:hypothetical protein
MDSIIRNTREFDIIKLIKSFMKTAKSKRTLLPRLYKTIDPELPQKSVIVVCGRCANANDASELIPVSNRVLA